MKFHVLRLSVAATFVLTVSAEVREDSQGPVEILSATRDRVVLNGRWRFMPAVGPASQSPTADWGLLAVPGTWQRSGWQHGMTQLPEPTSKGTSEIWKSLGTKLGKAWYEREIEIPASWKGCQVFLDFRRVSTEAIVWVNDKKCGEIPWPYGEVDITPAIDPGKKAILRVLVVATPDPGESIVWMGTAPGQNSTVKTSLNRSGIVGEVFLGSRPPGPRIESVFVKPSYRNKEVTLDVDLTGIQQPGEIQFTARMCDESGKVEQTFETKATVTANPNQTVSLVFPWKNPRLWDDNQPNLYTLKLTSKGAGLDDEFPQRFGFREFWIEGRGFFLNGTPIRLRPALPDEPSSIPEIDGVINGLRARGFNASQMWPTNHDERGNAFQHREVWAERADEKGWLTIGSAMSFSRYIYDTSYRVIWNDERRDTWRKRMEAELKRYRNHPSIIIWGTTGNVFNQASDQDPRHIGRRDFLPDDASNPVTKAGREALDLIRRADPTRPVFTHAGNRMGDIYTLNHYLNTLPLQEREEHLSEYAKSGDMPALSVEFGNLLYCDVMRGRNSFGGNTVSEPWLTETAVSYLGSDAYLKESPEYRRALRDKHQGNQTWSNWQGDRSLLHDENFTRLNALFTRNTWRSWRVWGYAGGMLPWDYHTHHFKTIKPPGTPSPAFTPGQRGAWPEMFNTQSIHYLDPLGGFTPHAAGEALFKVNGPTLSYIAGPAKDFADKDHHFRPAQTIEKSAAVINDTREQLAYSVKWTAELGGKPLAAGTLTGTITPARSLLQPIQFTLPAEISSTKVDGTLKIEARIGDAAHADVFHFRVFAPSPKLSSTGPFLLHDPAGHTTRMLDDLGIPHARWDGSLPKTAGSVLIIGREALSVGTALPNDDPAAPGKALEKFSIAGGRILLMAQAPDWMRDKLGLRVSRFPTRRVFPVNPDHPVLAGLDVEDLRDWAGSGTLIEPFPHYDPKQTPQHGWHWGNRGSVTSAAIEKPHRGGWRPLLECDFDLAYSPLMEMDAGKGRITLSTLDLEDQAALDPAAEKLALQLLDHVRSGPIKPKAPASIYLGDTTGETFLKQLGITYQKSTALGAQPVLAIIGNGANITPDDLKSFLARGGRAFVLGTPTSGPAALGLHLQATRDFPGATSIPAWPECAGLSLSDLHIRGGIDLPLIAKTPAIEPGADGLLGRMAIGRGVAIFSQLMPGELKADDRQWLRFTRWRQLRATSQILANLGATFESDPRIFRPRTERLGLSGEWTYQVTTSLAASPEPAKRHPFTPTSKAAKRAIANPATAAKTIQLPAALPEFKAADGEAVIIRTLNLPADWTGKAAFLSLGIIDDYDEVFINGVPIGHTDDKQAASYAFKRAYRVPIGVLKSGENQIAVRVLDVFGGGGITAQPADMNLRVITGSHSPSFYSPDYREDFELGDEPYRYYRW